MCTNGFTTIRRCMQLYTRYTIPGLLQFPWWPSIAILLNTWPPTWHLSCWARSYVVPMLQHWPFSWLLERSIPSSCIQDTGFVMTTVCMMNIMQNSMWILVSWASWIASMVRINYLLGPEYTLNEQLCTWRCGSHCIGAKIRQKSVASATLLCSTRQRQMCNNSDRRPSQLPNYQFPVQFFILVLWHPHQILPLG